MTFRFFNTNPAIHSCGQVVDVDKKVGFLWKNRGFYPQGAR